VVAAAEMTAPPSSVSKVKVDKWTSVSEIEHCGRVFRSGVIKLPKSGSPVRTVVQLSLLFVVSSSSDDRAGAGFIFK